MIQPNLIRERSLSKYRVTPNIVLEGVNTEITVSPIGKFKSFSDGEYVVSLIPYEYFEEDNPGCTAEWEKVTAIAKDGKLKFSFTFRDEQQWTASITRQEWIEKGRRSIDVRLYSLNEDLYSRTPYRGDLHSHSSLSDGDDDPTVVAANYRKAGFDFFALTDHFDMEPSVAMLNAYEGVELGFKMFRGEEVHCNPGGVHIVNFGGKTSVNSLIKADRDGLIAGFEEQAKSLSFPKGVGGVEYLLRKWIVEKIREGGGIAILAHPFWSFRNTNHMSAYMLDYIIKTGVYDAIELYGGLEAHENNLQEAYFADKRLEGYHLPIVGSSDSHRTDPASHFTTSQTVVFAKSLELDGIKEALDNLYSVAIFADHGEKPRICGSYRLVKFTYFLLNYYFPYHDELCFEEGRLMREYVVGSPSAADDLARISRRTEEYAKASYGKK